MPGFVIVMRCFLCFDFAFSQRCKFNVICDYDGEKAFTHFDEFGSNDNKKLFILMALANYLTRKLVFEM